MFKKNDSALNLELNKQTFQSKNKSIEPTEGTIPQVLHIPPSKI